MSWVGTTLNHAPYVASSGLLNLKRGVTSPLIDVHSTPTFPPSACSVRAMFRDADARCQLPSPSLLTGAVSSPIHFTQSFKATDASQPRKRPGSQALGNPSACKQERCVIAKRIETGGINETPVRCDLLAADVARTPMSATQLAILDNPSQFVNGMLSNASCDVMADDDPLIHLEQPKPIESQMLHSSLDSEDGLRGYAPSPTAPTALTRPLAPAILQSRLNKDLHLEAYFKSVTAAPAQLHRGKAAAPSCMQEPVLLHSANTDVPQGAPLPDLFTPTAMAPEVIGECRPLPEHISPGYLRMSPTPAPALVSSRMPVGRSAVPLPAQPEASETAKLNVVTGSLASAHGGVTGPCRRISFTSGHRVNTPSPAPVQLTSAPASRTNTFRAIPLLHSAKHAMQPFSTIKPSSSDSLHCINNMVNKHIHPSGLRHNRGRTAVNRVSATLLNGGDASKRIKAPTAIRAPVAIKPPRRPQALAAAAEPGRADGSVAGPYSFSRATTPVCQIMDAIVTHKLSRGLQPVISNSTNAFRIETTADVQTPAPASTTQANWAFKAAAAGQTSGGRAALLATSSATALPRFDTPMPTKNRTEVQVRRFGSVGERTLLPCNTQSTQGRCGRSSCSLGGLSGGILLKQATPTSARSLSLSGGSFTFTILSSS